MMNSLFTRSSRASTHGFFPTAVHLLKEPEWPVAEEVKRKGPTPWNRRFVQGGWAPLFMDGMVRFFGVARKRAVTVQVDEHCVGSITG